MLIRGIFAVIILVLFHSWASPASIQNSEYAGVGEGWTSTTQGEGIRLAGRMFTAPELGELCGSVEEPAKLSVREAEIRVKVGESFTLNRLTIHALDGAGRVQEPMPISMIVENEGAQILDLGALREMKVSPLRPGVVRFRVQTMCEEVPDEAVISFTAFDQ